MPTYFVWTNVNGVPYPQKWYFDPTHSHNSKIKDEGVLKKIKLSDKEAGMSINELKFVYPLE